MSTPKFTSITLVNNLGKTPASVNVKTGDLYINVPVYKKLTPVQKKFVLWHEHGHYHLKTRNEFEADKYAFENVVKQGVSLKELIYSLSEVLSGDSSEHLDRVYKQYYRAKEYDMKNNNTVSFFGKKAKAKREERKKVRLDRKDRKKDLRVQKKVDRLQRKNDTKNERLDRKDRRLGLRESNKQTRADKIAGRQANIGARIAGNNYKKMTLADQGVNAGGQIGKSIMGGVGDIVGGIFGGNKGGGADPGAEMYEARMYEEEIAAEEEKAKNNQMMIIAAVVVVALFIFMKMKK